MITKRLALVILVILMIPTVALADDDLASIFDFLQSNSVDLTTAIERAERETDGFAYEAAFDEDTFNPEYEVHVVVDGAVQEVRVNMDGETKVRPEDERAPDKKPMTLVEVVRLAESKVSGKAFEAECDDDRFDKTCEVTIATSKGTEIEVIIDTTTSKVVRSFEDRDD